MRILWAVPVLSLCFWNCGGGSDSSSVDAQISDTVNDTSALREATAAANEIIRNAADCSLVQQRIGDVNATLDQIESRIQTAAGRTSSQSLRTQVKNVADACGAF
jgi:hypothetical protein